MNTYYQRELVVGENELSESETVHCARSHRARVGDIVELIDGVGHRALATIHEITKTKVRVFVETIREDQIAQCERTWLCIAPTKHIDRTEWFLEKAVEVGVGRISFFYSERSERRSIRLDRIEKLVLEASKQCRASRIPIIDDIVPYEALLRNPLPPPYQGVIAHYTEKEILLPLKKISKTAAGYVKLLIGSEGGFTESEYASALDAGYNGVSIGARRLRTETAALVGCILVGDPCKEDSNLQKM